MALFRASVSGQAPLIAQLGPPVSGLESIGAKVNTVTFLSDTDGGEARYPVIFVPLVQGESPVRQVRQLRGVSESGDTSELVLSYQFSIRPSLPDFTGANIQELPYYLRTTYPAGQELVIPRGGVLAFYAYSPPVTVKDAAAQGHTWTLIVEWTE